MRYPVDANIVERVTTLPLGGREYTYQWSGGALAAISLELLIFHLGIEHIEVGQALAIGELQLRVVAFEGEYIYVCRDGWKAHIRRWWYRITPTWRWIKARLILTAYVWGMASYERGAIPQWRDIYVIRQVIKRKGTVDAP